MEIVTLFLMLVSVITRALDGESEDSKTNLSSCWIWDLMFYLLYLLNKWKEKQLEKMLIILLLRENSGLRGSKNGKTLL